MANHIKAPHPMYSRLLNIEKDLKRLVEVNMFGGDVRAEFLAIARRIRNTANAIDTIDGGGPIHD